jgi:predicted amidohydrolase
LDHQERIHLNITEEPYSFPGTTLRVYDLEFGKVGLLVGLDILFPEIARKLAMEGVEILVSPILSPGAGPDEKTKTRFPDNLYKQCAIARALENQVYIAMVNGIGQFVHVDLPLFGGSLVAGPEGKIYEADTSEVIKVVEIDIDDKEEALKEFPLLDVRNAELCKITE